MFSLYVKYVCCAGRPARRYLRSPMAAGRNASPSRPAVSTPPVQRRPPSSTTP